MRFVTNDTTRQIYTRGGLSAQGGYYCNRRFIFQEAGREPVPSSSRRILGLESYPSRIEYSGRLISVSICPMGIHPEAFEMTPEIG